MSQWHYVPWGMLAISDISVFELKIVSCLQMEIISHAEEFNIVTLATAFDYLQTQTSFIMSFFRWLVRISLRPKANSIYKRQLQVFYCSVLPLCVEPTADFGLWAVGRIWRLRLLFCDAEDFLLCNFQILYLIASLFEMRKYVIILA